MATPTNHWKLGLFVVLGVTLGLGTALVFGARSFHKKTFDYKSYFDESVQGLEIGAPVKFRGVTIGTVARIGVAPDRRHVEVVSEMDLVEIRAMGLASGEGKKVQVTVPPDLRVQLASAGITGVKFLQLDFFSVRNNPPEPLPFPVPENYIPVQVSTMKNLEDSVVRAVDQIPAMAESALHVLGHVETLLDDVDRRRIPQRIEGALMRFDGAFANLGTTLSDLDAARLSKRAQGTLEGIDTALAHANGILDRMDGEQGVVASAKRASDAVGEAVTNVSGLEGDLASTLRAVQLAADSIQRLTNALERDSDMLVKGRARAAR